MPHFHFKVFIVSLFIITPLYFYLAIATPTSSDLYHYGLILNNFSTQIWKGDLFPKWLQDTNAGLGSPTGIFYAPLVFYFCSLLQFLSSVDTSGFWRVLIAIHITLILSAYTARLWLKSEKFNLEQVNFGSIVYMTSPCTTLLFSLTFNPASLFAIAILPLALYFINTKQLQKFSLVLAALLLTHPPSFIVFAPLIFLYGYLRSTKIIQLVLSLIVALMISSFYLIPFYANLEFIDYQSFTSGKYFYIFNFTADFALIVITASTFTILFFLAITFRISRFIKLKFWYISFILYFLMVTPISIVVWWLIPFLQNLQFPTRFLIALTPISTYIFTYLLPIDSKAKGVEINFMVLSIIFAWIMPQSLFTSSKHIDGEVYKHQVVIATEYNTVYLKRVYSNYAVVTEKYFNSDKLSFLNGDGLISNISFSPKAVRFTADIKSDYADVLIKRIYFPGYDLTIDGNKAQSEQHDGLIMLKLNKGQSNIQLTWTPIMSELGYLISALGLVVVLLQGVHLRVRSKQRLQQLLN